MGSGDDATKTGALLSGALSFFLPCGFTLAMQLYAISTGSFVLGALSMGLFALGTVPGLIGIGWLTAVFQGVWATRFFRTTGVIVLLLGAFNLSNAHTLLTLGDLGTPTQNVDSSQWETQEIRLTQSDSGYSPNVQSLLPNHKIRLVVTAKNPYSCSSWISIPSVSVSKQLSLGENVIEFLSPASGEIRFSCSMGMFPGKFVIQENTQQ